ncbi:MAG: copper chaperone PCu(A)C [Steroidobacteraceae bacterium]
MNTRGLAFLVLPLILLFATGGTATGKLTVTSAWARATAPGAGMGAVYLHIENGSSKSDRLLKISTTVATSASVHQTEIIDDVARMREVAMLHVAPGEKIDFAPGGLHIMLIGLKKPLFVGQKFELEMLFEVSGPRKVKVVVQDSL